MRQLLVRLGIRIIGLGCWMVWKVSGVDAIDVQVRYFDGPPDSMGAYDISTMRKEWGHPQEA